jgi:hypothetical protein
MASPFTIFRKHQKVMLAAVTILCMFGFVFAPYILEILGLRQNVNPVVVTTTAFGKLTQADLSVMIQQHQRIIGILQDAVIQAEPNMRSPEWMKMLQNRLQNMFGADTEAAIVEWWLMARRAEKIGMEVDNAAINSFLNDFIGGKLDSTTWNRIFTGHGMSQRTFFYAMKDVLLANRMQQLFLAGLDVSASTPEQRWEYFGRLMRQATIESFPVPVARYVADIAEPDKKTVEKFFNDHQNDYVRGDSPVPGFREPYKTEVQYFKADLRQFAADAVTDQEIKDYYEKNKEKYDKIEADMKKDLQPDKSPDAKSEADKTEADKTGSGKQSADKTETNKTEIEKPAADKTETEKPVIEKPAGEKTPEDRTEAPVKPSQGGDSSSLSPDSPFRFVASAKTADESEQAKIEEASQESKTAEEKPGAEAKTAAAESSKNEEKPKSEDEEKAEEPSITAVEETPKSEEEPPEYPSEYIKNRIREELREPKLLEVFERLEKQMTSYSQQWHIYRSAVKGNPSAKAPAPLDFNALAKENHLAAGNTALVSKWDAADLDIAKSFASNEPFVEYVYNPNALPLFKPARSVASETLGGAVAYLYWKVKEVKEVTPKLDEEGVHARAVALWKEVEARAVAKKAAEEMAAKARADGKSLQDAFPDQKIVKSEPFSWMTFGTLPSALAIALSQEPARLSKVDGVDRPGTEFMRAVFNLSAGGIGVALNQPENMVYVIRAIEFTPPDDMLWRDFEQYEFKRYARVANDDQRQLLRQWMEELKQSAGLKWERAPDVPAEGASREEQ